MLVMLGIEVEATLCSFSCSTPAKPREKTDRDLVKYHDPKPLGIAKRSHFLHHRQTDSESLAGFLAALHRPSN